jgi:hypothetical protein
VRFPIAQDHSDLALWVALAILSTAAIGWAAGTATGCAYGLAICGIPAWLVWGEPAAIAVDGDGFSISRRLYPALRVHWPDVQSIDEGPELGDFAPYDYGFQPKRGLPFTYQVFSGRPGRSICVRLRAGRALLLAPDDVEGCLAALNAQRQAHFEALAQQAAS